MATTKKPKRCLPPREAGPLLRPDQLAFFDQCMLRCMDQLLAKDQDDITEASAGEADFNEHSDEAEEHCNEVCEILDHASCCAWLLLGERERQIQRESFVQRRLPTGLSITSRKNFGTKRRTKTNEFL
jgi:hypothetical protein